MPVHNRRSWHFTVSCVIWFFPSRVPLTTLNQPRLDRITRSRRKKGGVLWRAPRTTIVELKISPKICILEPVSRGATGMSAPKGHTFTGSTPRQLLAYITRPNSVASSVVGTFTAWAASRGSTPLTILLVLKDVVFCHNSFYYCSTVLEYLTYSRVSSPWIVILLHGRIEWYSREVRIS